jgi:hypothetical protein
MWVEHIENFEISGVAPAVRVLLPGIPPNVPISDRNNKNISIGVSKLHIKRFSFWCGLDWGACPFCLFKSENSEFRGQSIFGNRLTKSVERVNKVRKVNIAV